MRKMASVQRVLEKKSIAGADANIGVNPGVKREGLVFKSNEAAFSFKAISNSYLLKHG